MVWCRALCENKRYGYEVLSTTRVLPVLYGSWAAVSTTAGHVL